MTVSGKPAAHSAGRPVLCWRRWLPLVFVVACLGLLWLLGVTDYLSFGAVVRNRALLRGFVADHRALAIFIYVVTYMAITALVLPGTAFLTVLGGFLFGWALAGSLTVFAASIGATLIFAVARSSFGDLLIERGGRLVRKVTEGFTRDAFSYLLFLRLVPLFPFFVVNIATALCRVKLRTFFAATLLGIIPGTFAYAILGSGLDDIIETKSKAFEACTMLHGTEGCSFDLTASSLLTPELVAAFLILGFVALIPPFLKRMKFGTWV